MSRINEVQNRIKELEGGIFQKMCDTYLFQKYGLENISPLGSQEGTYKTTLGVPDTFIEHDDGTYTFIMYGTHKNAKKKLKEDILECLDESKTNVSKSKIRKIICCHTSTNISIRDIEGIKDNFKEIPVKIIGLGTLSQDIASPKFQGIAKDYLNLGFSTEQIFNIHDFVKAYDSNAMASPLDIEFKYRENKVKEIKEAITRNTVVLISGASGVGKTRTSLEICRYFEFEGYQTLCVKYNGQPLYDDFRISVSSPGKYLVFLDDLNQISDIRSVLDWILLNDRDDVEIKLIATVRDYAKVKVVELLNKFNDFCEVKIPIFQNEDIKNILDECLGIKNSELQNRITVIAKGNVRLAVIAGKLAIEDVKNIKNAAEIFKHYYVKIIDDGDLTSESIKILFIISLLNTANINDDNFLKILLEEFKISWKKFKEITYELHRKELVDLYLDEVVKISDQSFGNYILEYVLIEQKFISISKLLELGFKTKKSRIVYAINTILELFHSEEIEKYISKQVIQQWDKADLKEKDSYLETFYSLNLERTLINIKNKIDEMNLINFNITDDFFKKKQNYQNIASREMKILSGFKNTEYFEEAIELTVILLEKRPDLFMDIYFTLGKNFSYDKFSHYLNYKSENKLIESLWKLRRLQNWNYDFLLLKVIEDLLKTTVSSVEEGRVSRSIAMINIPVRLNDGSKTLRKKLWKILSELYEENTFRKEIHSVLMKFHWTGESSQITPVFEYDLSCIKELFVDKWDNPDFEQCLVLSKLVSLSESMKIDINSDFKKYENNEEYQYYVLIAPRQYQGTYEEHEKQKENEIIKLTNLFSIDNYKKLFMIAKLLESNTELQEYELGNNLAIVLKNVPKKLIEDILIIYFQCDAPFSRLCTAVIYEVLQMFGFTKVYELMDQVNFQYKNVWLRTIFEVIPEGMIEENETVHLLQFLQTQQNEEIPSVPRINTILKYTIFEDDFLIRCCKIICEISKTNKFIAYDFLIEYHQSPEDLIEIFSNNIEILEKLYMAALMENLDYNGKLLVEIVKVDPNFWIKYTNDIASSSIFEDHKEKNIFCEIWKLTNYRKFIHTAFEIILNSNHKYIGQGKYEIVFPMDINDSEVNKRIKNWILEYIRKNQSNHKLIHNIFFHFISNQQEIDRLDYIAEFLKYNRNVEDFKKIYLIPTSSSWSGSQVPLIDKDINFLSKLIDSSYLTGLNFISHKEYLRSRKYALEEYKKKVQTREYQEDFLG